MVIIHTYNSSAKRKRKFKSAEEKARYLAAKESEYGIAKKRKAVAPTVQPLIAKTYIRETTQYPSRGNGIGVASMKETNFYTGDKIKGIGTLHKSNAVPVFSDEEAKSLATMRR